MFLTIICTKPQDAFSKLMRKQNGGGIPLCRPLPSQEQAALLQQQSQRPPPSNGTKPTLCPAVPCATLGCSACPRVCYLPCRDLIQGLSERLPPYLCWLAAIQAHVCPAPVQEATAVTLEVALLFSLCLCKALEQTLCGSGLHN